MCNRLLRIGCGLLVAAAAVLAPALSARADQRPGVRSLAEIPQNSADALLNATAIAQCGSACTAPDNGGGTVNLPAPCDYLAPGGAMYITNGLPAGTQVECEPRMCCYFNMLSAPGGSLGGEIQTFDGELSLMMTGTGGLAYSRSLIVMVQSETHTAPRFPGTSPQSFAADWQKLLGQLPPGDPDFDLLRITAGTGFGMPSPGHTTLTNIGGGNWNVDSFFDIEYRIDFVGAPGGPFAGMSGSTTGTIRMSQGGNMWRPGDRHKMHFPQLPDESGWDVRATQPVVLGDDWMCSETGWVKDIHFWGSWQHGVQGQILSFNLKIFSDVPAGPVLFSHPGDLLWEKNVSTFNCTSFSPLTEEGWYEPNTGFFVHPDHNEYFQYDITLAQADWFKQTRSTIYWLCIEAIIEDTLTTRWGWKSSVEHFNDDAVWAMTTATGVPCVVPDNGTGTVDLPANCPYGSNQTMDIINGLPPGTTIESNPVLDNYFGVIRSPGGSLGGEIQQGNAILMLNMNGTGGLLGYNRFINMPMSFETHTAPRIPGTSPQSFDADMISLMGQLPPGDPDFDLLRITAGTGFGMPSPGHTTLTSVGGGNWNVDSFFDIEYRIDFIGHAGGPLSGMSGSTTATIRMQQGSPLPFSWDDIYEPPTFTQSLDLAFVITGSCCVGIRGDCNNDGQVNPNVLDLNYLVNRIFRGGAATVCPEEGDVNSDGTTSNIIDLNYLVNRIFRGGPLPGPCL